MSVVKHIVSPADYKSRLNLYKGILMIVMSKGVLIEPMG